VDRGTKPLPSKGREKKKERKKEDDFLLFLSPEIVFSYQQGLEKKGRVFRSPEKEGGREEKGESLYLKGGASSLTGGNSGKRGGKTDLLSIISWGGERREDILPCVLQGRLGQSPLLRT